MKLLKIITIAALTLIVGANANAQTFSKQTIDTSGLAQFQPGDNNCTDRAALETHACEPWLALVKSIEPPAHVRPRGCVGRCSPSALRRT